MKRRKQRDHHDVLLPHKGDAEDIAPEDLDHGEDRAEEEERHPDGYGNLLDVDPSPPP